MAYIYKITNLINNKCYIGKTEKQMPEQRFQEHLQTMDRFPERPLYRAIKKYGFKSFSFEVIEETNNAEEQEKYWIKFYGSYGSAGYNATLGGDGKKLLDYNKIIEDYQILQNITKVAENNNCDLSAVADILKANGVILLSAKEVNKNYYGKKVLMLDKNTLEIVESFNSQMEGAIFLKENGFSNIADVKNLSCKIGEVCRGKRKSCSGFKWRYDN